MKKSCNKCKQEKDVKYFSINKASKDGFEYYCKDCISDKVKNNYGDKQKKSRKERYSANREAIIKQAQRAYYAKKGRNPDDFIGKRKFVEDNNRDKDFYEGLAGESM